MAIDADRSQIRSAQREELADLELGDVLGKGFIAEIGVTEPMEEKHTVEDS